MCRIKLCEEGSQNINSSFTLYTRTFLGTSIHIYGNIFLMVLTTFTYLQCPSSADWQRRMQSTHISRLEVNHINLSLALQNTSRYGSRLIRFLCVWWGMDS